MFKTIFNKLTAVFISISIFSFSVASIMLYYFLGKSVVGDMSETLVSTAKSITNTLNIYRENWPGDIAGAFTNPLINITLNSYCENTGSVLWIIDREGRLIKSAYYKTWDYATSTPILTYDKFIHEFGYPVLPNDQMYKKVMTGNYDIVQEKGDFYGMFEKTGKTWLTIEKPIKYINSEGKTIVEGAILLHAPVPDILRSRSSVFRLFMLSVLVSMLISITLVYLSASRITKPLKEMANAARLIAKGEKVHKLDIKSNDEVGELAANFNYMAAELQNHENSRREFLANISHELRTPMTSIKGFVEGILDGTIPKEKENVYLTIVKDENSRMSRMVNDLLDLSKIEAGELKLVIKKVNINELIRRCIIKMESLIEKKSINIELVFEDEDVIVSADPDAIERVVINLLHNAVKFTPIGGKVEVGTYRQKDKIYVSIKDNGIGIDEKEVEMIWQRFYKSDKSRGQDRKGTGLGLAIVKNLISEHKQNIWVKSQLGKGTEFIFTLDSIDL